MLNRVPFWPPKGYVVGVPPQPGVWTTAVASHDRTISFILGRQRWKKFAGYWYYGPGKYPGATCHTSPEIDPETTSIAYLPRNAKNAAQEQGRP